MNIYERSYKRVRADGLSQPDLIETLRAPRSVRKFYFEELIHNDETKQSKFQ